ncbi:hypothetical protein RVF83_22560 [Gordonia rubripertincta]|uniref:DUF2631 domain-containing protein n=2 Tax=Gordonia rubripertincta TaxID=36822 RepID=A0AAW6R6S3_GORRU|nr:hypothetical protein [Gordonia rubripertincta]MDG6779421.1 hypothetical protein [Gordonia rubripertincta]NKY62730.1 hypothetical protein [Gordonia rubripertincta]QMU18912.1 hypothetical protein H3V45_12345 [Gordonia rubripertincta]GAB85886.1 hypothetical protein GORBP_065_02170 [Gordonia rubripertincta NBRC 101908]
MNEPRSTPALDDQPMAEFDNPDAGRDHPDVRRGVLHHLWEAVSWLLLIGWVNNWFTEKRRTVTAFALAGLLFVYGAWQFIADRRERENDDPEPAP